MRKHRMPEMKEGGVNVTPLIDIVMCMIIFFMLVAKIGVTTGADSTIVPPSTILGSRIDDLGNTITLNVRDPRPTEAAVDANGKPIQRRIGPPPEQPQVTVLVKGEMKEVPLLEDRPGGAFDQPLLRVLKEAVQGNPREKTKGNPGLKVIILADKDLDYYLLEQVLLTTTAANVKNVNFQTKPAD